MMIESMDTVVQRVGMSWTKESRGGREAVRRSAAPTAFPIPSGLASALHEVSLLESSSFQPHAQVRDLAECGMNLLEADGFLTVSPPEAIPGGVPRRDWRPPAVRLAPGQWLRWQINYRFGGRTNWTYRLETFNVAYGPLPPKVFLSVPTRRIDERGSLR
jgi:hypothetical protein